MKSNIIYSLFVFLLLNIIYCNGSSEYSEDSNILNSSSNNGETHLEDYKCHSYSMSYFIYDTFYITFNNEYSNDNVQKIEINTCVEYNYNSNEYITINQFKKPNHYYIMLSNNKDCSEPYEIDFLNCVPFNLTQSESNSFIESDGSLFKFKYGIGNIDTYKIEQIKQTIPRCSNVTLEYDDLYIPYYVIMDDTNNSNQ